MSRTLLGLFCALLIWLCVGCGGTADSQAPVSVAISPKTAEITRSSLQYFAESGGGAVTWQVNGIPGGNLTVGTISQGLYTAPASVPNPPTVTVSAISQDDSSKSDSATVTIDSTTADPLGTIKVDNVLSCSQVLEGNGGLGAGTCHRLTIACPGVADQDVGLKLNTPSSPIGTVVFTVGGGGTPWYDQGFAFGIDAVSGVFDAGFTTAQLNFGYDPVGFPTNGTSAGWLTGPGGPRALACRWATATKWVHDQFASDHAFCATGNSGGGGAAAYAVAHYGLDSMFNMLELSSGPPFSRIDNGCICPVEANQNSGCPNQTNLSECYEEDANRYLDPAYSPTGHTCSSSRDDHTNEELFLHDSLLAPGAKLDYPNIDLHFVYGGQDNSEGPSQGTEYWKVVTGKNGKPSTTNGVDCVADAPHALPDVADGAAKIAADVIEFCHK